MIATQWLLLAAFDLAWACEASALVFFSKALAFDRSRSKRCLHACWGLALDLHARAGGTKARLEIKSSAEGKRSLRSVAVEIKGRIKSFVIRQDQQPNQKQKQERYKIKKGCSGTRIRTRVQ